MTSLIVLKSLRKNEDYLGEIKKVNEKLEESVYREVVDFLKHSYIKDSKIRIANFITSVKWTKKSPPNRELWN